MSLIDKIMFKFQKLLRFEKLDPVDNFEFRESFDKSKSTDTIELFKKAFDEHPELKEVIWIAIYHCLNTFKLKNEYLTVLNYNFDIIVDLIEGDENGVKIPYNVKQEILKNNVLSTFHNHFNGAIIPSSRDLKNTVLPYINFMVITSHENIGIIVNDCGNLDEVHKQLFINEWLLFEEYINFCFFK